MEIPAQVIVKTEFGIPSVQGYIFGPCISIFTFSPSFLAPSVNQSRSDYMSVNLYLLVFCGMFIISHFATIYYIACTLFSFKRLQVEENI